MLDFNLNKTKSTLRILCIGAHCDDIEIGCGGTLLELQRRLPRLSIAWVILSGSAERRTEASHGMRRLIRSSCRGELRFGDFPDGRFPASYGRLKDYFVALRRSVRADLVLAHECADRHQDHRITNEMVWTTFRDHTILEYEIPKWDGGLGQPNFYVPVSRISVKRKIDTLLQVYATQGSKDWFSRETFASLMRLRGLECRSPSGYAEAFHGRKLRLG